MKRGFRLVSLRESGIVEFRDVQGRKLMLWHSKDGWWMYYGGRHVPKPRVDISSLHAQAIAYGNLMGTCEGFPEQEIDV